MTCHQFNAYSANSGGERRNCEDASLCSVPARRRGLPGQENPCGRPFAAAPSASRLNDRLLRCNATVSTRLTLTIQFNRQ